MALVLVIAQDFGNYRRGTMITDPVEIDVIRSSEYASLVVLVSDTIILPPVPPEDLTPAELLAAYRLLAEQTAAQQAALDEATSLNQQQSVSLGVQNQQLNDLTRQVNILAAKVENPNGGEPIPPNLADDRPLAEDDDVVLVTDAGKVLAGDLR